MSYSRTFTKQIAVHYSGSISYPASETGGTRSFSGTVYEDVTVNIHVDTAPFDSSVASCNTDVNILTGAVTATEAAQVASIRENAQKVGNTIISGFFKTVRYEISNQITELTNRIDATLLHLRELSKRCSDKKLQMEADYQRISSRYLKIFKELDTELKNRVYELDRPVFDFRTLCDTNSDRASQSDSVSTVAVSGMENSKTEALISASRSKKQAWLTINSANKFLMTQKRTEDILQNCILQSNDTGLYYAPICYIETNDENQKIYRRYHKSHILTRDLDSNHILDSFSKLACNSLPASEMDQIKEHYLTLVASDRSGNNGESGNDSHKERVSGYLLKMFNDNNIKTI